MDLYVLYSMDDIDVQNTEEQRSVLAQGEGQSIFDLSLLLASQHRTHWIDVENGTFRLEVPSEELQANLTLINLWKQENNKPSFSPISLPPLRLTPFYSLWFLIPWFMIIRSSTQGWYWHQLGRADAQKILNGEWWRTITALTLHADSAHILSNLLSGYFIFNLLGQHTSQSKALLTLIGTSALANYGVAIITAPNHLSVGFSTVVFGALGLLSALETKKLLKQKQWDIRRYSPILGGICMVVMMGLGQKADIWAHVLGFLGGLLAGIPYKASSSKEQPNIIILAYALLILGWTFALL